MSIEQSYTITLKMCIGIDGSFESIRLLKARSQLSEDVLDKLNKALQSCLVPTPPVKTTVAIGDCAEQKVMNHLLSISRCNSDFEVIDTSSQTGHGDLAVIHQGKRICIEVKCYSKPVPMKEVDKYHRSLELSEYDAGIIIQLGEYGFAPEAKIRSPIDFRIHEKKPSAYLTAIDLDMLYPIINMSIIHIGADPPNDANEIDAKRKALISIYEKASGLRSCIDTQKKTIIKMEALIENIISLSTEHDS